MTDHDDRYDAYRAEFGARLSDANRSLGERHGSRARRLAGGVAATLRRPLVAGAVACIATLAAVVGVVSAPGGEKLDPVARASAALAPDGQIIYMRLTSTPVATAPDMTVPGPQTTEYWTASEPTRWRMAYTLDGAVGIDEQGPYRGRLETAYADGATYDYIAQRDSLRIITGHADGSASRVPSLIPLDPERDIRPMLERGELRDTGELVIDGRRVRRLHGETTLGAGDDTIKRITYDVDAETFEPVGGRLVMVESETKGGPRYELRSDFRVDRYERFPDDAAHAHLLKPQTTPQTKVTTETVEELRKRIRQGYPADSKR